MKSSQFPNFLIYDHLIVLSSSVILGLIIYLMGENQSLFLFFNQLSQYTGSRLWAGLTLFGETIVVIALLLPLLLFHRGIVWAYLLALLPGALIIQGTKAFIGLDRPAKVLDISSFNIIGDMLYRNSFPSGHTATIFALAAIVLCSNLNKVFRYIVLIVAVCTGISRMAVGAHWPLDILAGLFLGYLIGWFGVWVFTKYGKKYSDSLVAGRLIWLFCLVSSASIFFRGYAPYPTVEWLEFTIVLSCIMLGIYAFPRSTKY